MTTKEQSTVTVTGADIRAAEDAMNEVRGYGVRIGPGHFMVQAFARHRIQALEDAAKVADEHAPDEKLLTSAVNLAARVTAHVIATAIRAMKTGGGS